MLNIHLTFLRSTVTAGFLAATAVIPLSAQTPWSQRGAFVFGDSSADMGNFHALPGQQPADGHPYFVKNGFVRMSSGAMWPELLYPEMQIYSDPKARGRYMNYAFGSAKTGWDLADIPDVKAGVLSQIEAFAADLKAGRVSQSPDAFYFIEAGPNDWIQTLLEGGDIVTTGRSIAQNLSSAARRLSEVGAKTVFVHEMPDFGYAPLFAQAAIPPDQLSALQAELAALTRASRDQIQKELSKVAADVNGRTNVVTLPLNRLYTAIRNNPAAFGFTHVADAAYDDSTGEYRSRNLDKYLFVDWLHLGAAGQRLESRYYQAVLESVDGTVQRRYARLTDGAMVSSATIQQVLAHRLQSTESLREWESSKWSTFAAGVVEQSDREADVRQASFNAKTRGFAAGVQYRFTRSYSLGGAVSHASQKLRSDFFKADVRGNGLWLFAQNSVGPFQLSAVLGETVVDFPTIERDVSVPLFAPKASTDGRVSSAVFDAAYSWNVGSFLLVPSIGFESQTVRIDGFRESGAPGLDLEIARIRRESFSPRIGLSIRMNELRAGGVAFSPFLSATLLHNVADDWTDVSAQLIDNTARAIVGQGWNGDRTRARVAAGVQLRMPKNLQVGVRYSAAGDKDGVDEHGIDLHASLRF
jgi:outer membrane autotransporter protein